MTSPDIKDHVVLVAGAAGGIGREITKNLITKGALVAACDKNLAALKSLRVELANQSLHTFEIDFLNDSSIKGCVDEVELKLGPLKAAINCVGVLGKNGERVELIDLDDFDLVYRINLRGALVFTKAIIGGMAARGYGRILHLSSISGKEGNPLLVAYSATKAGLIGLVKSVGKEYATTGVTINAMAPALVRSPMTDSFSESQLTYLKLRIPMNRLGDVIVMRGH